MQDNTNDTFYGLVSGLQKEERVELLRRMQSAETVSTHLLETVEAPEDEAAKLPLQARMKTESLLYRLWIWLRSVFSSTTIEIVYNQDIILRIAHAIEKKYPDLISYKHGFLANEFFQKLHDLREAVKFFNDYLFTYEKNPGGFYVVLSSILLPQVGEEMEKEVNPYSFSMNKEFSVEMRNSLLRKMDEILGQIPPQKKAEMYACVRSLEWLRALNKLPFDNFLSRFFTVINDIKSCPFNQADGIIEGFAKVLCNGATIPDEVMHALYLFTSKQYYITGGDELTKENSSEYFIEKSSASLEVIGKFVSTVPMRAIARVVTNDALFQPGELTGGEEWFVKYKAEWKRLFDIKWEMYVRDCKKELVRNDLTSYFFINAFPLFPKRPWNDLWGGVPFEYELSLGFIFYFIKEQYTKFINVIKTITLEGDFSSKDNRYEFGEASNTFTKVNRSLDDFLIRLNSNGSYGSEFEKYKSIKHKSKGGVQRITAIMEELASQTKDIIRMFGDGSRLMLKIMNGILDMEADAHFASLNNIATICGHENAQFKEDLEGARVSISHALDLLKEIEPLDKPLVVK